MDFRYFFGYKTIFGNYDIFDLDTKISDVKVIYMDFSTIGLIDLSH